MPEKVTLSLPAETLARARADAERTGTSLSAWMDRAARHYALRDAGRQYDTWLENNPEINEQVAGWRALTSDLTTRRWSNLAEAA